MQGSASVVFNGVSSPWRMSSPPFTRAENEMKRSIFMVGRGWRRHFRAPLPKNKKWTSSAAWRCRHLIPVLALKQSRKHTNTQRKDPGLSKKINVKNTAQFFIPLSGVFPSGPLCFLLASLPALSSLMQVYFSGVSDMSRPASTLTAEHTVQLCPEFHREVRPRTAEPRSFPFKGSLKGSRRSLERGISLSWRKL